MAVGTIDSYYKRSQDVEALKQAKRDELKRVVDAVYGQLDAFHREHPGLSRFELIEGMKSIVLPARYDGDNYLWVQDLDSVMLIHPSSKLTGKDMSQFKDPKGNYMIRDMTEIAKRDGEGMSSYWWPKRENRRPSSKFHMCVCCRMPD